jgi:DNA-binding MltR family transcriptional regulator
MAKRSLIPVEGLSKETQSFYDVLNSEPDLSVVLVAVSYIDACLGALLERFLLKSSVSEKLLDPRSGALGSFGARADAGYSLGLVEKPLYQDLLVLSELRNQFAHHHLALNFSIPSVVEQCEKLSYAADLKDGSSSNPLMEASLLQHPRNRFVLSVVLISQRLLLVGLGVKRVQA